MIVCKWGIFMDKDVKIAKIGAIGVIVAAVIGGLFAVSPSIIENNKLKEEYEKLVTENSELVTQNSMLQETNEKIQNKYDNLNSSYITVQNKYEVLEKDYNELLLNNSDNNETILEADQKEIDEILELLNEYQNGYNKSNFIHLLTDKDEIELFYKMYISIRYYKYSNLITAFNEYGIDCEELSINENTLIMWDVQYLYIYCQIKENVEKSEKKEYLFNDYKMELIDTCDYRGYGYIYEQDRTYESIANSIDDGIETIIKKMKRNSLPVA